MSQSLPPPVTDSGLSFVLAGAVLYQVATGQFLYLTWVFKPADITSFTDKGGSRNQPHSLDLVLYLSLLDQHITIVLMGVSFFKGRFQ